MAFLDLEGLRRFKNKLDEKFSSPIEAIRSWKPAGNGRQGQVLRSNGDGTTSWQDVAPTQDVADAVDAWMNGHISPNTAVALDSSLTSTTAAAQGAAAGNMVLVADVQPAANTNKVWIKKTPESEVLIPTMDDHNELVSALNNVANEIDTIENEVPNKVDSSTMQKCQLINVPKSPNLWDKEHAEDGMLHTNGRVYTGGNYEPFCYMDDYIPVVPGDVLTCYKASNQSGDSVAEVMIIRIASYDADKNILTSSGSQETYSFTIPSGVSYVRLTYRKDNSNTFMVFKNAASAPTEYIPYYEEYSYYVADKDFIPDELLEGIIDDAAGSGSTDKVWSADKSADTISTLNNTVTGINSEVSEIKSTSDHIEYEVDGVVSYNYTSGKKITADSRTYSITDDENTCVSELIEITWDWDTSTYVRFYYYASEDDPKYFYRILFFDENHTYIGNQSSDGLTYRSIHNLAGGKYVMFSFRKGTVGKLMLNAAPNTVCWEATDTVITPGLTHKIGNIESLETTEKSSIVGAVNEVSEGLETLNGEVPLKVDSSAMQKCQLINVPKSDNLYDKSTVSVGILYPTGVVYPNYPTFRYGTQIPVDEGDVINFYHLYNNAVYGWHANYIACYDESGTAIPSAGHSENVNQYTVPESVKSIAVTITEDEVDSFMLLKNNSSAPAQYIPYNEAYSYYVATDDFVPRSIVEGVVSDKVDKDGVDQIVPRNCVFMSVSPNLFDPESISIGLINKGTGAVLPNYPDWRTSDWIEVDPESDYVFSTSSYTGYYYSWYNENKQYISGGEVGITSSNVFTSPEGAKYHRFSFSATPERTMQFEKGSTPTRYMPYGTGNLLPEYAPELYERVGALEDSVVAKADQNDVDHLDVEVELIKDVTIDVLATPETNDVSFVLHDGYLSEHGIAYPDRYLDYGYSDKIDVQPGDIIHGYNGAASLGQLVVLCEYANDAFVKGYNPVVLPYTVPEGVDAIAFSATPTYKETLRLTLTRDVYTYVPKLQERVEMLESGIAAKANQEDVTALAGSIAGKVDESLFQKCQIIDVPKSPNLWNPDHVEAGMLHTNGNVYTGGSYEPYCYCVDYIPVEPGDVFEGYKGPDNPNDNVATYPFNRITSYDANKNVLSSSGGSDTRSFTVPNGVAFVRITGRVANLNTFMALKNIESAPTEYIPYYEANRYYIATEEFIPGGVISEAVRDKVDKDGVKQITPQNCTFMGVSPNMFDANAVVVGLLNKGTGAVLPSYTDRRTSDWIEVEPESDYVFSTTSRVGYYYCWYNANKQYISGGEVGVNSSYVFTSPANAKYHRFSFQINPEDKLMQFERGSVPTQYFPYKGGYLLPECVKKTVETFPLNLPSKVYASVGTEMNFYFDNMVDGKDIDYVFDTTCDVGMQLERGYRITATAANAGVHTLTISAKRKWDGMTVTKSASLIIADENAGSGTTSSVIIIGDSTTDGTNSNVIVKLRANFADDAMNVSTLGTRGASPNNHEGRSGWRFNTFMTTDVSTTGVVNAFYNPATETFDANYYFTNTGVAKPDWFFINLGINDMFGFTNDKDLLDDIEVRVGQCDAIIESVHSASPNTKCVVCLTIPPNYSQDAFGKEYKNGQHRARYKRNNILWVQRLMEVYEGREAEGVYVCPINLCLDTVYNMGFETLPVNARNTDITYQSPIGNGGVHPVVSGYWQIADMYKAFIKANASS